jgi:cytochrome c peroxidase
MKKIPFLLVLIFFFSCNDGKSNAEKINEMFKKDISVFVQKVSQLEYLVKLDVGTTKIQKQFLQTRKSYKKLELLCEYYFPEVSKAINGPAIEEFDENDRKIESPQGLQVIEEFVFSNYNKNSKTELLKEMGKLSGNLKRLVSLSESNSITDAHVFDAMRLEVFRITTLGITGFDAPIAQNSIAEAQESLATIEKYYSVYANDLDNDLVLKIIKDGKNYLKQHTNFNSFDRAHFILNFLNPLSKAIYKNQSALHIPVFKETRALKTTTQTLFDKHAFDTEAFVAFQDYKTTPDKIELGKLLFSDKALSEDNSRSCSSCHYPEKAFTDAREKALGLDQKTMVKRNTPTLSNIAFQRAYFYDSRVSYLEDQAIDVIANITEMHGSMEKAISILKNKPNYVAQFKKAFPKKEIDAFGIKNALASYIRSLSDYDSKFDGYMRGEENFNEDEKAGFNLFAGKAKCATCHFIPLTNGTVPPNFDKSESEVLGVPDKNNKLDVDLGKFEMTKSTIHRNSFKTPTIRNIALTAPYMHNGVFKTLDEVIDFYNKGGGFGLGFKLENQTLPEDKLNLTPLEKKQLIDFMRTLTDKKNTLN